MGDESRFRYRLLDEGQARDGAASNARAMTQDPRRPETRGRSSRDYGRTDAGAYAPAAPTSSYADEGYGRGYGQAPAQAGGADGDAEDSLAELAKLIGDEDPFADFTELDHGQGGVADSYDEPEPPRAERFSAPVPVRGQSAARAAAYEPAPATRAARAPLGSAYGRQATDTHVADTRVADTRGYDDTYGRGRGYAQDEASYDDDAYEAPRYGTESYETGRQPATAYDDDGYSSGGYDSHPATARQADSRQADTYDDYAPARRSAQLPARLSATRDVAVSTARSTSAASGTGAVRSGYGSLARRAPSPQPEETAYDSRDVDARGYDQDGYETRAYDRDGYDDRSQSARGYDDQGYDDAGYAPRSRDTGHGDRSYAGQGYGDQGYDSRGYDDRGYQDDGRGGYGDEATYAYAGRRRADGSEDGYDAYDGAYDPEFADEGYMPPHGEDVYETEPRRRKGRMALLMAASVIGLLVAGVAAFFAYRMAVGAPGLVSSGKPPVIRADSSPAKVVTPAPPATDGQQKLIYDRMGGGASPNEHVVPREEQPVDVATASAGTTGTAGAPGGTEPKRVRTLTVRADGSIVQDEGGAAATPGPSASAYAASQNPIPTGLPDPTPVNSVRTGPAQTASANPPVSANGAYVVQVASQRSEADAQGSWKALQTRYPSLLSGYRATVKRADLGERGVYYRAQVGPFASRDQANQLCNSLREQGGDCLVSKN